MCSIFNKLCCHNVVSRAADVLRVVLPDAGAVGEARGGRGASGRPLEQLRGDWAEMRVLQWFRGERSQRRCC